MSAEWAHVEGTDYDRLLNEALPLLGMSFEHHLLGEFHGGEQIIGADDVVRTCLERGIRLSDEAMEELELDADARLNDSWHTIRHYSELALQHIAGIRALDAA